MISYNKIGGWMEENMSYSAILVAQLLSFVQSEKWNIELAFSVTHCGYFVIVRNVHWLITNFGSVILHFWRLFIFKSYFHKSPYWLIYFWYTIKQWKTRIRLWWMKLIELYRGYRLSQQAQATGCSTTENEWWTLSSMKPNTAITINDISNKFHSLRTNSI